METTKLELTSKYFKPGLITLESLEPIEKNGKSETSQNKKFSQKDQILSFQLVSSRLAVEADVLSSSIPENAMNRDLIIDSLVKPVFSFLYESISKQTKLIKDVISKSQKNNQLKFWYHFLDKDEQTIVLQDMFAEKGLAERLRGFQGEEIKGLKIKYMDSLIQKLLLEVPKWIKTTTKFKNHEEYAFTGNTLEQTLYNYLIYINHLEFIEEYL